MLHNMREALISSTKAVRPPARAAPDPPHGPQHWQAGRPHGWLGGMSHHSTSSSSCFCCLRCPHSLRFQETWGHRQTPKYVSKTLKKKQQQIFQCPECRNCFKMFFLQTQAGTLGTETFQPHLEHEET